MYHYAGNNPVKYTDPTGMYSWDQFKNDVGPALNFDFGRDYSILCTNAFRDGDYFHSAVYQIDVVFEMAYDGILFFGAGFEAAKGLDATVKAFSMLRCTIGALSSGSTVVLGRYCGGTCGGYTKMAESIGANYFQIPDKMFNLLQKIKVGSTDLGSIVNEEWLNGVMKSGSRILLNYDPLNAPEKSAYDMEVKKLMENGYEFIKTVVNNLEYWEAVK